MDLEQDCTALGVITDHTANNMKKEGNKVNETQEKQTIFLPVGLRRGGAHTTPILTQLHLHVPLLHKPHMLYSIEFVVVVRISQSSCKRSQIFYHDGA